MVVEFLQKKLPERWARVLSSRVVNDLMIVLIVLLGYLLIETQNEVEDTQECFRDFLVDQAAASAPRIAANADTDEKLAEAVSALGPLIKAILVNALSENPDAEPTEEEDRKGLELVVTLDKALTAFDKSYANLVEARKNFPPPPAPEDLCKD